VLFRDGGSFDLEAALEKLVDTYGVDESAIVKSPKKKGSPSKRKAGEGEDDGEAEAKETDESPKAKKAKKADTVAVSRSYKNS
jgi:hypothetical protein